MVSGTTVCRAQQAKLYTLSGNHFGRKITSGGSWGSASQDHRPNRASQIRVNTRLRSTPPCAWTHTAARAMCDASTGSPASRSATHASTVVDRSPGPP